MNKTLSLLFFGLLQFASSAQIYQPFPDSGATWSQFFIHHSGPVDRIEDRYTITTGHDTIIQGITYTTLWKSGVETEYDDNNQVINITSVENIPAGCIREDSLRRVYFWAFTENLLYDFSLNVNDSLVGNYLWNLPSDLYVSSIDSIFDGSIYRKQFHLSVPNLITDYMQLIEGIGSTWGLINLYAPEGPTWGNLYCFRDGLSNLILDTAQCLLLNVPEYVKEVGDLYLFPNPGSDRVYIGNLNNLKVKSILILNPAQQVLRRQMDYSESTGIDVSALSNGIYFLQVKTELSTFNLKLLRH
jgi:hypothetical protein